MATRFGNAIGGGVDQLVRWVILPVTGVIPVLVRTGLLLLAFVALWFGFFAALIVDPAILESVRRTIEGLPLAVQLLTWVLFLPVMGGLWAWTTDWPLMVRVLLVVGLAGWNLVMFIPRRETTSPVAAS